MKEQQIAAASYVIQFYQEVQVLTDYYGQYVNVAIYSEEKRKSGDTMNEQERTAVKNLLQNIRRSVLKTTTMYLSLKPYTKTAKKIDTIERLSDDISNSFLIKIKDLKSFVLTINKFLVDDIIKTLLESSSQIMNKLYDDKE